MRLTAARLKRYRHLRARHMDSRAAFDHECRPVYERGFIRREEEHSFRHILRSAESRAGGDVFVILTD
jgi:hypothetical protein